MNLLVETLKKKKQRHSPSGLIMGTILKMNMRRRRRAAGVLLVMKSRKPLVIQDAGVSPG